MRLLRWFCLAGKKPHHNKKLPVWHTNYLADELARLGWNPIAEYIRSLSQLTECIDACSDPVEKGRLIESQANLIEKIWKYCFPTKRSVEVKGEVEHKQSVSLTQEQLHTVLEQDVFRKAIEIKVETKDSMEDEEHDKKADQGSDPFTL